MQDTITIYGTKAFAGNDIIAVANQPVQLNASGGFSYAGSTSTGLRASKIPDPVVTNNIKIYKGPEICVPGAFTPNGDGRNDVLKALPVGISSFEYFVVYNRYG